jgi:DNA-binding NtrC family response regulator
MYFPRADGESVETTMSADEHSTVEVRGKSVLLVEDQPDVREVLELYLAELGYRCLSAEDAVIARRVLEGNEPIDLLLTDVVMPNGISGLDLAQDARRLRQDLKVVLVSGYLGDFGTRMAAVPDALFLTKPFNQKQLGMHSPQRSTVARQLRFQPVRQKTRKVKKLKRLIGRSVHPQLLLCASERTFPHCKRRRRPQLAEHNAFLAQAQHRSARRSRHPPRASASL